MTRWRRRTERETERRLAGARAAKVPRSPIVPLPDTPIEYPPAQEPEVAPEEEVAEPVGVPEEPVPAAPGAPA